MLALFGNLTGRVWLQAHLSENLLATYLPTYLLTYYIFHIQLFFLDEDLLDWRVGVPGVSPLLYLGGFTSTGSQHLMVDQKPHQVTSSNTIE